MEDDIKEDSHVDARGLPSLSRQSSTTLSSDSSATSVVLSSSEIYNRIAYSRPSTGSGIQCIALALLIHTTTATRLTLGAYRLRHYSDLTSRSRGQSLFRGTRSGGF